MGWIRTNSRCVRRSRNPPSCCHKDQRRFVARQRSSCTTVEIAFYGVPLHSTPPLSWCAF
ncbi:uncharacterized protein K444DRAFT_617957 [Hyaloscypha bicolor E]|uniref:Uncharacterized protein n=1 Tax=Hyaloscypha bicolor E TaxID=1095630 RepID=A0A2J6SV04_9HELO|nr:uncharacterized protein K444DRAFT_617957 [Hyaloscypha bicolor E]PMD54605.1 hypothetical protein K444DRAFT_617957 [Hyaloscypha bicolor E]